MTWQAMIALKMERLVRGRIRKRCPKAALSPANDCGAAAGAVGLDVVDLLAGACCSWVNKRACAWRSTQPHGRVRAAAPTRLA